MAGGLNGGSRDKRPLLYTGEDVLPDVASELRAATLKASGWYEECRAFLDSLDPDVSTPAAFHYFRFRDSMRVAMQALDDFESSLNDIGEEIALMREKEKEG